MAKPSNEQWSGLLLVFINVWEWVAARVPRVFGTVAGGVARPTVETVEATAHARDGGARIHQRNTHLLLWVMLVAEGAD